MPFEMKGEDVWRSEWILLLPCWGCLVRGWLQVVVGITWPQPNSLPDAVSIAMAGMHVHMSNAR
jgi:hypothetical protein